MITVVITVTTTIVTAISSVVSNFVTLIKDFVIFNCIDLLIVLGVSL